MTGLFLNLKNLMPSDRGISIFKLATSEMNTIVFVHIMTLFDFQVL